MAESVKVALFVRLEAKAGKEAEVEQFLRGRTCAGYNKNPPPWHGLAFDWDRLHSEFSMRFPTRRGGRRISPDKSRQP